MMFQFIIGFSAIFLILITLLIISAITKTDIATLIIVIWLTVLGAMLVIGASLEVGGLVLNFLGE